MKASVTTLAAIETVGRPGKPNSRSPIINRIGGGAVHRTFFRFRSQRVRRISDPSSVCLGHKLGRQKTDRTDPPCCGVRGGIGPAVAFVLLARGGVRGVAERTSPTASAP